MWQRQCCAAEFTELIRLSNDRNCVLSVFSVRRLTAIQLLMLVIADSTSLKDRGTTDMYVCILFDNNNNNNETACNYKLKVE